MERQAFAQELVGARLDKYEVMAEVGFGGMSMVYRARDVVLDREVALKILHTHLAKREESRRRLRREAQAVAKLRHPNIVEIYDFSDEESEQAYLVTEFIHGPTLRQHVDERGMAFPEVGAMIGLVIADALAHAHELGVIHRDVKPENVMIRQDGVVKLMDFGIAQLREAERVTETGSLLGSPAHMAPEVVSGEEPDVRSDVFSFGTVLYFLTTGELPFTGRNAAVVLRRIVEADYVDPEIRDPKVGRRLGGIVRRCLAEHPRDRYASMDAVSADLRACLEEVGLRDVQSELRQYFTAPQTYERALRTQLLERLERLARAALEGREVARAADFVNRLLAIDEHHEVGRRLLGRLDRRRRVAALGVGLAALLALAALVALAAGAMGGDTDRGSTTPPSSDASATQGLAGGSGPEGAAGQELAMASEEPAAVAGPRARSLWDTRAWQLLDRWGGSLAEASRRLAESSAVLASTEPRGGGTSGERSERDRDAARERRRETAERLRVGAPAMRPAEGDAASVTAIREGSGDGAEVAMIEAHEPQPVTVFLRPGLPIVNVRIDGTDYGDLGENPGGFHLSPGRHVVTYSHDEVQTAEQVIDVEPGRLHQEAPRFPLSWRPARLIVASEQPGQVFLDGDVIGRTNDPLEIPINTPRPPLEATIAVVVNGRPRPQLFPDIAFRPNQSVRLVADLEE